MQFLACTVACKLCLYLMCTPSPFMTRLCFGTRASSIRASTTPTPWHSLAPYVPATTWCSLLYFSRPICYFMQRKFSRLSALRTVKTIGFQCVEKLHVSARFCCDNVQNSAQETSIMLRRGFCVHHPRCGTSVVSHFEMRVPGAGQQVDIL